MRQHDNFHKKAHKTGDDAHWSTYRMLRNQVTYNLRKYRRDYFKNKLEQNKNPKGFWKTLNYVLPGSKKKKSLNINEIVYRDQVLTDPQQISNALNSHLTSIAANTLAEAYTKRTCNDEAVSTSLFDPDEDHNSEINFRHLNNEEAYKALVNLNPTKASGADNIPANALKVAAGQIAPSLAYLFNQSFQQGVFPAFWKTAKVTALPNGKDNTLCDNFQPTSVLPCLSKVMEKFANNQLQTLAL